MKRRVSAPGIAQPLLKFSRKIIFLAVLIIFSSIGIPDKAQAAFLTNRSVQLGTSVPTAIDTYDFKFFVPSTTTLGSIVFEFCSNSAVFEESCTPPPGLDTSTPSLPTQSGNTGFSVDNTDTTANKIVISRTPLNASVINSNYVFNNIINPSNFGVTTYIRISTYPTADGTGPMTDHGAVAFVTVTRFQIGAFVPPFLKLCVGVSVAPDCSSMSGDRVNLGILSANKASAGVSQFSAGTNSPTGYAIYGLGSTMTSGVNFIAANSQPNFSFPGTGQFGINLRANLSPPVGSEPLGLGTAAPTANYNSPNLFMFRDGDMLASAGLPSDYNRMTVSYLVNVPSTQDVGVYSTTITYQAVAQF